MLLNIDAYETAARERLERSAYDYYAGGAGDELTLAANRSAFGQYYLRPRALVDASHVDLSTRVLDIPISCPIMLAPTAFNRMAHSDGERAAARAAGAAGTLMVASTIASTSLEDIAEAATGPMWFQLYIYKDRGITRELVARAERSGYKAIVLTVDTPLLGRRERDVRNNFVLPAGVSMRNFEQAGSTTDPTRWNDKSSFSAYVQSLFDPSLSWKDDSWLQSITRLPLIVKGVLTKEDAMLAAKAGVQGLIVSNHGGRQLDGVLPTVIALPEVVEGAGTLEVMLDGGIRRGTDVLKALGLGARAVLIGRPYLWGLAVAGEEGVRDVLQLLRGELELAMALAGRPTIPSIDRTVVCSV